ncbi:MAG TPA: sensor histidine kinase [Actinomycetota bacterium]|nr:sensor histidine kinase [Actinomycetota bacterium]
MSTPDAGRSGATTDRPRWAIRFAWAIFGITIAGYLVREWLQWQNGGAHSDLEFGQNEGLLYVTFPLVGVVLATKLPRNPLGWMLLAIGIAFLNPGAAYARYASITQQGELPGAGLALALHYPGWVVFIGLAGFLLLLFPDGHLPTPRWRWFAWTCGLGLALLYVVESMNPEVGSLFDLPRVASPFAVKELGAGGSLSFLVVVTAFAPLTIVAGAVAVVQRLRRVDDGDQREQLRWLAWAAGVTASLYSSSLLSYFFVSSETWKNAVGIVATSSFALIPVAIGIAVLRYRLYDIDFVIRKTVVIAIMAAVIAAVYVAVVVGVGGFVGSGENPVLSALAAAVVAIVFQPARTRARRFADRVVYGKRATPYEVMAAFGDQLAGTYASADVLARTARVLGEGIGAERARVWLQVGDDLEPVAAWPADEPGEVRPDDFTAEVRHQGELLGALSVAMPPSDPINPSKERLVRDLAVQAGLVLRNERLTTSLKARLGELKAAQKRLVAARDAERRRLERNIHDGAQQQLVALQVRQRLAHQLIDRDPAKAKEMLSQVQIDTGAALEDLRDLARGIYPPLLADKGLAAALAAQVRKGTVPVRIDADGIGRFPQEIEAAVYFSVLEALQNTAKYAGATAVTITLREADHELTFSVTDDGRGFDATANGYGTGLQGITDRLGALEGEVTVESGPGRGTVVSGRVPLEPVVMEGASS